MPTIPFYIYSHPPPFWLYSQTYAIINLVSAKRNKKEPKVAEKPLPDLKEFIENINKKDKPSGKKIRFAFTKRKRKR
jgi:uncharacterized FlaG/YvyC family protein